MNPTEQESPALNEARQCEVLWVINHRRWVAEELEEGCRAWNVEVRHSMGLGVPNLNKQQSTAWWSPLEHLARVGRAGVSLNLIAPGPSLLSRISEELLGRRVWSGTVSELNDAPRAGFAKPAEAKIAKLPAQWYDTIEHFKNRCQSTLPPQSWVQVADRRLELTVEHRLFIAGGRQIVAESPYLIEDGTTWHENLREHPQTDSEGALAFGREAVAELAGMNLLPPACSLDVARLRSGQWVIVELNPSFSSGFYGGSLPGVARSVLDASELAKAHPQWAWEPDAALVARAERLPVLPQD